MGRLGSSPDGVKPGSPILQVGGVQEAVRVAPPRLLRAVAVLLPVLLVVVPKAATSGLVVLQVRGGADRGAKSKGAIPYRVSIAVAVTDTLPPLFTVIEFPAEPWPPICR